MTATTTVEHAPNPEQAPAAAPGGGNVEVALANTEGYVRAKEDTERGLAALIAEWSQIPASQKADAAPVAGAPELASPTTAKEDPLTARLKTLEKNYDPAILHNGLKAWSELKPLLEQSNFLQGFENAQPGERERAIEALLLPIMRGHLSGQLLGAVLDGGITYTDQLPNTHKLPDIDNIAFFIPSDLQKDAAGRNHMQVSPKLFALRAPQADTPETAGKPTPEYDTSYVIGHELSHALYHRIGHQFFHEAEYQAFMNPTQAYGTTEAEPKVFVHAFQNGLQAGHLETPYVQKLLAQHAAQPQEGAPWRHVANEMLTERLAIYLASDGSLADFLKKRLEHSTLFQAAMKATEPTTPAAEHAQLAQTLEQLLTPIRSLSNQHPPATAHAELVRGLQTISQRYAPGNPPSQAQFANFLKETLFLHSRFTKVLRGEAGQPLWAEETHDKHLRLIQGLNQPPPTTYTGQLTRGLADYSLGELPFVPDSGLMGAPTPQARKGKTFWQALAQFFDELISTFH